MMFPDILRPLSVIGRHLALSLPLVLLLTVPMPVRAADALERTTVPYRTVDGHEILADVYRPPTDDRCPLIVWIHGGGLIMGHREQIHPEVRALASQQKYALVSIDYRLAPETKLPQLISDVEAAFRWIGGAGAQRFRWDADRIAVCGGSAGGYLTLVTGYRAVPRPKALVALYGYGNLIGEWYSTPSPHPRHNQRSISSDEAARQSDGTVVSDDRQRNGNGGTIYLHYRQQGIWPERVSGFDRAQLADQIAPYEPWRNVRPGFPPTMLIHGTADTDVPFEESTRMAKQFEQQGVPYVLQPIPGGEHGFGGGSSADIENAYRIMRAFIVKHLEGN